MTPLNSSWIERRGELIISRAHSLTDTLHRSRGEESLKWKICSKNAYIVVAGDKSLVYFWILSCSKKCSWNWQKFEGHFGCAGSHLHSLYYSLPYHFSSGSECLFRALPCWVLLRICSSETKLLHTNNRTVSFTSDNIPQQCYAFSFWFNDFFSKATTAMHAIFVILQIGFWQKII